MNKLGARAIVLQLLAAFIGCLLATPNVSVASPTVIYTFAATNDGGVAPASKLLLGLDQYLYGTTSRGGAYGAGVIYDVSESGTYSILYSFPPATNASGEVVYDLEPNDLALGNDGNFYGTTQRGGSNFNGAIYTISPTGSFTVLHVFGTDGAAPQGALVQGSDGNFYGTTLSGGAHNTGTIFQISSNGTFASLYSFAKSSAGSSTTNGAFPNALILGSNNVFYGTTRQGGVGNAGTFFKFTAQTGFTQISSFNGASPVDNPIGPTGPLAQGVNGNFYGASTFGGAQGGGCIFEITLAGGVTVLHSFPLLDAGVAATLTIGNDSNLYGTTPANGLNGNGSLFRLTPAGDYGAYAFASLYTNSDNAGGANPLAALTADDAGNLYGTCAGGGTNGSGVVFQVFAPNFIPPSFLPTSNSPPALTNLLTGSSITLFYSAQGYAPLSYQWVRNGTNLSDGGDLLGSLTNNLLINPVSYIDAGSYALIISNIWGALTSAVTVVTVTAPGISISSPLPNSSTATPVFAGTATEAPLLANANPNNVRLTNVIYSISNLFDDSVISGMATLTANVSGASNWSFAVTPNPGTNILYVQSVDASGNISHAASVTFFYKVTAPLEVQIQGSGTGAFSITNGSLLNLGENYSITARPAASIFDSWNVGGVISFQPTVSFVMQSNLVMTADFMSRQLPAVSISSPAANTRTGSSTFQGTAKSSPVLPGADPASVQLTNVIYWLTNLATGSVLTGSTVLSSGVGVTNWSVTVTSLPGTNTLAVQAEDISGGLSPIIFRTFFYKVPAVFTLSGTGSGTGTFAGAASIHGNAPPTNGALLNVGETYSITAKPAAFSTFSKWISSAGLNSSEASLTFSMQPDFSLTATFLAVPPVVTISSPAQNQRTAAPVFQGTASGHSGISSVICSLVGASGSATLTTGAGSVSNWSITLAPSPGTNTLTVHCTDKNGNNSLSVSRRFFYKVSSPISLSIPGPGNGNIKGSASVAGDTVPANGAMLNIGEGYTITALPDRSSLFSNWVGTVGGVTTIVSGTPALSFVMQSNLELTVNFTSNFFPSVSGTYNGLFSPPDAVSAETSGMLNNLVLQDTGVFSGRILMPGTNYNFTGRFDATGNAGFRVGPLQAELTLDTTIPQITGTVSGAQFSANLSAELASTAWPSAEYTLIFSPSTNVSDFSPPGDGYALVTNHAGLVTLTGALADGTSYSQSVPVTRNGDLPFYASPYTKASGANHGLILTWINLTNLESAAMTWIKKPARLPALYTNGFTNILSIEGALWTNPLPGVSAITLTNGQLVMSNQSLFLAFTNIAVGPHNSLTNLSVQPANSLTGSINPKTGLFVATIANDNGGAITNYGAILQTTTNGGGYFLTRTNAGAVNLMP